MWLSRLRQRPHPSQTASTEPPSGEVRLTVNGHPHDAVVPLDATLLRVLRNEFGYTGAKEACGRGECGACTVIVGGRPILACVTLAARVDEPIVTIEGLAEPWSDLRVAFAETGGFQCGFCTPGQIAIAAALLANGRAESREAIRHAMSGNICRCTGYVGIVEAVERASLSHANRTLEVQRERVSNS